MHDPMTVAHEVPNPLWWRRDYRGKLRPALLATIWHVDPNRKGDDDSCGRFMRGRHCDQKKLEEIAKAFKFEWTHGCPKGWFDENGDPNYSSTAITLGMFRIAANVHFGHWSKRADRFLRRHAFDILHFAENSTDSLCTFIEQPYGKDERDTVESRAKQAASIVYSWICRKARPWYRNPKWHVWHWRIQVHPLQGLHRRLFTRCAGCGRGFKASESVHSLQWDSPRTKWFRSEVGVYHHECSRQRIAAVSHETVGGK